MDRLNKQNNDNTKVKVVSIGGYKDKAQEKARKIKDFEEGPQPLEGCTCGQHTDMNQILTEDLVTEHYLKDRKRYVEGLRGKDPMEIYMDSFKSLTGNRPLVRIAPSTDLASIEQRQEHFGRAMKFYQQYILEDHDLTHSGQKIAEELKRGYEKYKEHLILRIRGMYVLQKLEFIRENSDFAGEQVSSFPEMEILESNIGKTKGYIEYINECFAKSDDETSKSPTVITGESLDMIIDKKLNGDTISDEEVKVLGTQLEISLGLIERMLVYTREVDYKSIKKRYDQVKDDSSIEDKAEMLIDLELRSRQIDGSYDYASKSGFTVKNSTEQLIETIGMEEAIGKLSTQELETLLKQFKSFEE